MEQQKKEKPPLYHAARMVYDAIETAYRYKRDKNYMPTPEELKLFDMLEHSLYECHNTARDITRSMHERMMGEKEGEG